MSQVGRAYMEGQPSSLRQVHTFGTGRQAINGQGQVSRTELRLLKYTPRRYLAP